MVDWMIIQKLYPEWDMMMWEMTGESRKNSHVVRSLREYQTHFQEDRCPWEAYMVVESRDVDSICVRDILKDREEEMRQSGSKERFWLLVKTYWAGSWRMGGERSALGCCPRKWGSLHDQGKEDKRSNGGTLRLISWGQGFVLSWVWTLTLYVEKSNQRGIFGL